MSKVAIVTDTISCIPRDLVKEYDINIIPVGLVIDRKVYLDYEISNEKFWELFGRTKDQITTNAVNPADFEAVFTRLSKKTDSICCVLVSGKLSATHHAAVLAKDTLQQIIPSLKIEVIDSTTAAGGEGFIVLEAARSAGQGQDLSSVVKVVQNMIPRVKFVTAMQTLKYLIKSGRAPKSAIIGNWLQIKPIIGMVNGTGLVDNLGRTRGMDKAIEKMIEMVIGYIDRDKPVHLMVHYTDDKALGEKIKENIVSQLNPVEVYFTPYTPVMASQTGPVVAIAFYQ
jgi:DegV family protein with EDD domain